MRDPSDVLNSRPKSEKRGWSSGRACWVKSLPVTLDIWVLVHVLAAAPPIQLPTKGLGKAVENGPSACAPANHIGDLEETSGCCCRSEPVDERSKKKHKINFNHIFI